jgi:hypothetical protein
MAALKVYVTLLSVLALLCFTGCEETPTGAQSVPSRITGTVSLVVTEGLIELADRSGVRVAVNGTSFTTTTDATGNYSLNNVPPGIYVLTFSKDSYDTVQRSVSYSGVGFEFVSPVTLFSLSEGELVLDAVIQERVANLIFYPDLLESFRIDSTLIDSSLIDSVQIQDRFHYDTVVFVLGAEYRGEDSIIIFRGTVKNVSVEDLKLEFERETIEGSMRASEFAFKWSGDRFAKAFTHRQFLEYYYSRFPKGTQIKARLSALVANNTQLLRSEAREFRMPTVY